MFDSIKEMIARDSISEAISTLKKKIKNQAKRNKLDLISGRYHHLKENISTGTLSHENISLNKSIIRRDLMEFIKELENSFKSDGKDIKNPKLSMAKLLVKGSKKFFNRLCSKGGRFEYIDISNILLTSVKSSKNRNLLIDNTIKLNNEVLAKRDSIEKLWDIEIPHSVILGDGGMGKTVSMVRLWESYLNEEGPIPIFVALNEYNQVTETKSFITRYIAKNYLQKRILTEELEEEIWEFLQEDWTQKFPKIILLLDGFNEITVPKEDLLVDLNLEWRRNSQGVQILLSSRYGSNFSWTHGFHTLELLPLRDSDIQIYLDQHNIPFPNDERLLGIINNPMMLTIFAASSEMIAKYLHNKRYTFKVPVSSVGELMWNFIEAQVVKYAESSNNNIEKITFYKWLLKHLLPFVAHAMEKEGLYEYRLRDIKREIKNYFIQHENPKRIGNYIEVFSDLDTVWDQLEREKNKNQFEKSLIDKFSMELHMLKSEGPSFSFLHQNFRDFFSALHIRNEIKLSLYSDRLPNTLKDRTLPIFIRRMLGQIEGEHHFHSTSIRSEVRNHTNHNKSSMLYLSWDKCRGVLDFKDLGFTVWNILSIWKNADKDLTELNASQINLQKFALNSLKLSRPNILGRSQRSFRDCKIDPKTVFPIGHKESINIVVYSPDGRRMASGSLDSTIKEWDCQTGECIRTFQLEKAVPNILTYSPDGKKIAAGYNGQTRLEEDSDLVEWDCQTGDIVNSYNVKFVYALAYSNDGVTIVSGSKGSKAQLEGGFFLNEWDCQTGRLVKTFEGHLDSVTAVVYCPQGNKILSGSLDKIVKEWDRKTGECIQSFTGHTESVTSVAYNPRGNKIVSGSLDKTIREWDCQTGECIQSFEGHLESITAIAYDPKGNKILSSSADKTIKEWDPHTGECINNIQGHSNTVNSVSYSSDGKRMVSGASDHIIKEWDCFTGECIQTIEGHIWSVNSVAYSPDGHKIVYGSGDATIKEWDCKTGECIQIFQGHQDSVNSVVYSPDGKRLISGSSDSTIKEWDSKTGECIQTLVGHLYSINDVAYSPDGEKIVSGSVDSSVMEWECESGKSIRSYLMHTDAITSVEYNNKGNKIISGSKDKTVKEWDCLTGNCLRNYQFHKNTVTVVAYSPDGKRIASGSLDHTHVEWDSKTGTCINNFQKHASGVLALAYSPDGKNIVSASDDTFLKKWDCLTGKFIRVFYRISGKIISLAYCPDGKRVASGSKDAQLKEWDCQTGDDIHRIPDISGLWIQDCDFRGVIWEPPLSQWQKATLKRYGAILTDEDKIRRNSMQKRLRGNI